MRCTIRIFGIHRLSALSVISAFHGEFFVSELSRKISRFALKLILNPHVEQCFRRQDFFNTTSEWECDVELTSSGRQLVCILLPRGIIRIRTIDDGQTKDRRTACYGTLRHDDVC